MTTTTQNSENVVQSAPLQLDLRDWFAGQALPAIISKIEGDTDSEEHLTQVIGLVAKAAYRIADAMIAARKQKGSCNG